MDRAAPGRLIICGKRCARFGDDCAVGVEGTWEKPRVGRAVCADGKRADCSEGAEAFGLGVVAAAVGFAGVGAGILGEAGAPKGGVERGAGDGGEGPRRAVAREGATHGTAITEEKDVSGLEEDSIHGGDAFRRRFSWL